jgi:hypothetical protein
MSKIISFDQVFKIWLEAEVEKLEGRDILPVAIAKGFTSIAEWRLATCLRMGMDKKAWRLEELNNPVEVIPNIIIGPYQGWSKFFENKLQTSYIQALDIPDFFEWVKKHDRIPWVIKNFPLETTLIVFKKPDGSLIHIEGGHRMCAVAYCNKIGQPIDFTDRKVFLAVTDITEDEVPELLTQLRLGTDKQITT